MFDRDGFALAQKIVRLLLGHQKIVSGSLAGRGRARNRRALILRTIAAMSGRKVKFTGATHFRLVVKRP